MSIWKRSAMALDTTVLIKPLRLLTEKEPGKFAPQDKWDAEINGAAATLFTSYYLKQGAAQGSKEPGDYDNPDALGQALRKATQSPDGVVSMTKFFDKGKGKAGYSITVGHGVTAIPAKPAPAPTPAPATPPAPSPEPPNAQAAPPKPPPPIQTADDYEADRAERLNEQAAKDLQRSVTIVRQAVIKALLPVRAITEETTLDDLRAEADYWVDYVMSEYNPKLPRRLHRQIEAVVGKNLPEHREEFKKFLFEKCGYLEMADYSGIHLDRLSPKHAETVVANIEAFTKKFAEWQVETYMGEPETPEAGK